MPEAIAIEPLREDDASFMAIVDEAHKKLTDEIIRSLGIPTALFGYPSDANYAALRPRWRT